MLSKARIGLGVAVMAGFGLFSSAASADYIATIPGNDCSGVFGSGFENCVIPDEYDPLDRKTPIIIKFDSLTGPGGFQINSSYPTINGSEFTFNVTGEGTGTWTYNPGEGDPVINFFVAKGGPGFNLFSNTGDLNTDTWTTPTNPSNGRPYGLSHLSFYDEGGDYIPPKVPEPATMLLLGAGLLGVGLVRRRKRD